MTEAEAENMTGYQARYLELRSLLDTAYENGLPLPDRLFVAETAPDALAEAVMDEVSEQMDGRIIHKLIKDKRRTVIEIREGSSVYRWAHIADAIVHAAARQPAEPGRGNYVVWPQMLREQPDKQYLFTAPPAPEPAERFPESVGVPPVADPVLAEITGTEHITESGAAEAAAAGGAHPARAVEIECPSCNTDDPDDYRNGCEDGWHVDASRAETDCVCRDGGGDDCPCEANGPDGRCECCRTGDHRGTCEDPSAASEGDAAAVEQDECPMEAVFGGGAERLPCRLPRGHEGRHDYVPEPDANAAVDLPRPGQDALGIARPRITGPGQPDETAVIPVAEDFTQAIPAVTDSAEGGEQA